MMDRAGWCECLLRYFDNGIMDDAKTREYLMNENDSGVWNVVLSDDEIYARLNF
jgi:hypothetical protein